MQSLYYCLINPLDNLTSLFGFLKVDENVLKEMAKIGFDIHAVIESLCNNVQNEVLSYSSIT